MTYLTDKVAIVTGSSRGIGFAIVQHLLRNGISYVAIFDVHKSNSETVNSMRQSLDEEFGKQRYGYYNCDVTSDENFNACYDQVTKSKNYVDILINNAGICDERNPDLMISINFTAVVKCTLTAIERMNRRKGNEGGSVVNIASIYGLTDIPLIPIYNATKHAVVSFVRSMKDHNENLGVRVMCVCPGLTRTLMTTELKPNQVLLDFVTKEMIEAHGKLFLQSPENIGSAVVGILEKGKEGEVWLAQDDKPPIVV